MEEGKDTRECSIRNRQRSAGLTVSGEGLCAGPSAGWGACGIIQHGLGVGYTGLETGRGVHCSRWGARSMTDKPRTCSPESYKPRARGNRSQIIGFMMI